MSEQFSMASSASGCYDAKELKSALQKSIRRGFEEDAIFWASRLAPDGDLKGAEKLWARLRVIASEDIGIAAPSLPAQIRALYENWRDSNIDHKNRSYRLFIIHAVILLCRAKKSRLVDHATIAAYEVLPHRDIPNFALDKHTVRGGRLGRGYAHFFDEGAKLANKADIPDPYEQRVKEFLLARERRVKRGEDAA